MKVAEGRELVKRLALASDIVMENFRPGVLERLGLSADELRKEKPSLIWCSISGFGQDGPYRNKPAYDMIVQALSGGMSLTGEAGGAPVRAGIPIADLGAGTLFGDRGARGAQPAPCDGQGRDDRYLDARLPGGDAVLPGGLLHAFGRGAGPARARPRIDPDLSQLRRARTASQSSSPRTPSACGRGWRACSSSEDLLADPRFATNKDTARAPRGAVADPGRGLPRPRGRRMAAAARSRRDPGRAS